jgi:hypothetical protein
MKNWKEFLIEGELDDLRRDLIGLGFTRKKVIVKGSFMHTEDEGVWSCTFESEGVGDGEKEAASYALLALIKLIKKGSRGESVVELRRLDSLHKKMRDRIIVGNFTIQDLDGWVVEGRLEEWTMSIKWEDYEGEESEGECKGYWKPLGENY